MNAPNDLRWLHFATVPYHRYVDVTALIARGIGWSVRRICSSAQASRERFAKLRQHITTLDAR
jgi:hypothetical protein